MRETIWGIFYGDSLMTDLSNGRGRIDPPWAGYLDLMQEMWRQSGLLGAGAGAEPGELAAAIERYNAEVIATVPEDRLLVWSVTDGWEPLCAFLGIDVPEAPFPNLNDSSQFADRIVDGALLAIKQWREAEIAAAETGDELSARR
jgi:hypothetical protein